jgi:competence protein ComGF
MLIVIICILSVLVVILGFTTFNLMKKQEKAEDVLMEYLTYLDKLSRVIEASDKKLKEIDSKETFKSDDEIGFFFKSVQQIQDILNEFKVIRIKQE